MAPRPMTPSVLPGSSKPTNAVLPFSVASLISTSVPLSPAANAAAGTRLRAASSMPAITSSFTAFALAPGVLNTTMPRLLRSATGMLFVPAPARATASTESGSVTLCRSAERTSTPSASSMSDPTSYEAGSRSRPSELMALNVRMRTGSAVLDCEVVHERDERVDALPRHGVVDAGPHATDRSVAGQVGEARGGRVGDELLVELRVPEQERHVHDRAAVERDGVRVEVVAVDEVVERGSLGLVDRRDAV